MTIKIEAQVIAQGLLLQAILEKQAGSKDSVNTLFHEKYTKKNTELRLLDANKDLADALLHAFNNFPIPAGLHLAK